MKSTRRLILCLLTMILCFSFSGCGRMIVEIKSNNEMEKVNEYIESKYTDDTFNFVHKSVVPIRDTLFGYVKTKYNVYRFKSSKYQQDFYVIWEQDKYAKKHDNRTVYDNYSDLKYYDRLYAEIESVAAEMGLGNYEVFFDLSCIDRNYKYSDNPYLDEKELSYDEYLDSISVYPAVIFEKTPKNIENKKEEIKSIMSSHETIRKLSYFQMKMFFGNVNNSFEKIFEQNDVRENPVFVSYNNGIGEIGPKELDAAGMQLKVISVSTGNSHDIAAISAIYYVKDNGEPETNEPDYYDFSGDDYLQYDWN